MKRVVITWAVASCLILVTACSERKTTSTQSYTPAAQAANRSRGAETNPARVYGPESTNRIAREVRHELIMLPYYGVFDNLAYRVDGSRVTLLGQVTRPTLKSDAENVVKRIEGVESVDNQIQVLPVSPNDDRLRLALYRAIYGHTALNRYALAAVPSIHIIVNNGNVTLEGVVANESDKNIAGLQANSVPGVFKVTNDLQVEGKSQPQGS